MTGAASRDNRRTPLPLALLLVLTGLAQTALAHEFWLLPETFEPRPGEELGVRLFVGDGFEKGRAYSRNPLHVRYFNAVSGTVTAIEGTPGQNPAGRFTPTGPGVVALAYRSTASDLALAADKFEKYLREEGLERISKLRAAAGETEEPGREAFSRCAKSLVLVGGGPHDGFDRRVGLDLEIVPLTSPFALAPGATLPVLVLWKGEPLPNAQVRAFVQGQPQHTFELRTGEDGQLSLPIALPGTWLLSVVHMNRAAPDTLVDWQSTWSSLTFHVAPYPPEP